MLFNDTWCHLGHLVSCIIVLPYFSKFANHQIINQARHDQVDCQPGDCISAL